MEKTLPDELVLINDLRLDKALDLFNSAEWYLAHDAFEELWHETQGEERNTLQAILQIAVAQVHLENGNKNGATILFGEALGRISRQSTASLGLDLQSLSKCVKHRLTLLQTDKNPELSNVPFLYKINSEED